MDEVLYLINPLAKDGQALSIWKKIQKQYPQLPKDPLDVSGSANLKEIIQRSKPKIVAVAGGDGTINTVCAVVSKIEPKPLVAILPLGFGNAISFCLGVETIEKAMRVLQKREKTITIDLMKTNIKNHDRGVFNISAGFDARIVFIRQNYRYIGPRSYIISALQSFVSHPENEMVITVDRNVTLNTTASSLVIANCPVIGQNYVISPSAKLNDGLLDCTIFSTKYAYLTNLRLRGFKHPLYSELGKTHFKAKHIRIEGEPFVQIDGDPVVQKDSVEIEILPLQITFLRNTDEEINQEYFPFVK